MERAAGLATRSRRRAVAQENDAERAVRAALAIQRSLVELNSKNASFGKPALAARIAIRFWGLW